MSHRRLTAIAAAALLAGSGASILWGHDGDTSQVHSCVARDGTIRIIAATGTCKSQETALDWNITGPAGPAGQDGQQGLQGNQGIQGEPGLRGPSDGYTYDNSNIYRFDTSEEQVAAQLALDAGNYVVNAKVTVGNTSASASGGNDFVGCTLRHGTTGNIVIDQTGIRLFPGAPDTAGSYATLSLASGVSLSSPDTIRLLCTTTITDVDAAFIQYTKLNAVKVETLTPQ